MQNFAMFVPFGEVEDPFKTAMEMIDLYYCELEKNSSLIAPVFSFRDIMKNREAGKMSALLTIEEGETVLGKLSYLRDFYRLGVRMIALTWNFANQIGCPNMHPECEKTGKGIELRTEKGLTPFGIEMIQEMERWNDRGCFSSFRRRFLGCVPAYREAFCGQSFQCCLRAECLSEPDR